MRTRLPLLLGLATGLCCFMAGSPQVTSFIHPYPAGGKQVATAFTRELINGLDRYKVR